MKQLHRLAKGLLKHETLNREEINDMKGILLQINEKLEWQEQ